MSSEALPAPSLGSRGTLGGVSFNAALGALWLALAWVAMQLPHTGGIALIWPSAGLALGCLVRFGAGLWPAVFAASVAINLWLDSPLAGALLMASGNTAEALLGTELLRRSGFRPALDRQRDVLRFLGYGVCLAPLPAALLGTLGLMVGRGASAFPLDSAAIWWLHDAAGILVVAPLVLSWPGRAAHRGSRIEAAACALALLVTGALAFSPPVLPGSTYPLAFLPFPALVWAALRFGPAGGAGASAFVVTLAAVLTRRGGGLQPGPETIAMVWIFLSVVGVTSLFGAALVAERDRATEERAEGERQLRQVIDLVPHFVFVKDRDGRFLLANRAMAEAYGATVEQLTGARGADFLPYERVLPFLGDDLSVIQSGKPLVRADEALVDAAGRRRFFHTTKVPFFLPGESEPAAVLGCAVETTEWRQAEEALRRAQRLAAVGDLAGGMAHEIRNPLFALSAGLDAIGTPEDAAPDEAEMLRQMRPQIERLTRLVSDFQSFATPLQTPLAPHRFRDIVEQAVAEWQAAATARRARLELSHGAAEGRVLADPARLRLAIGCVVDNALRYSPEGGTVVVSLASTRDHLVCRVRDRGPGFAPDGEKRAFEPFETSERDRFGLGLAIAQRVVADHGGQIAAENLRSGGTRVSLSLPTHAPPDPA